MMTTTTTMMMLVDALTEKDLSMLPIVIADVDVESTLIDMCKQADILLNCVGPVWTVLKCFATVATDWVLT